MWEYDQRKCNAHIHNGNATAARCFVDFGTYVQKENAKKVNETDKRENPRRKKRQKKTPIPMRMR